MNSLVLGYTWVDGGIVLRVRHVGELRTSEIPLHSRITIGVTTQRQCLGYQRDGQLLPCPDRASPRTKICATCATRDEFRPCMICDGSRCPKLSRSMERYCRQTHHLYLACFGSDTLKVGTASDGRRTQRIVEQGPLAAARVAHAEGPIIKQMEAALVATGFTEAMRRSQKTALLRGAMKPEEAVVRVEEGVRDLAAQLPGMFHRYLHSPVFIEMPELTLSSRGMAVNDLPIEPGTVIEGDVAGAIGHVLFIDDGDGRFAVDLGGLVGWIVDFDPKGPKTKPQVQLGLF